jgi:hypothetical protein
VYYGSRRAFLAPCRRFEVALDALLLAQDLLQAIRQERPPSTQGVFFGLEPLEGVQELRAGAPECPEGADRSLTPQPPL